jgi:hypothetical protein
MHKRQRRRLAPLVARFLCGVVAGAVLLAPQAGAQSLSHAEDATTPPKGLLRLRAMTAWRRYDSRFLGDGTVALGAAFSAESLGVAQLPSLSPIQALVQSASQAPFTLSLGRSRLDATAREEIVPILLEYGLTNRLAFSISIPIVRKRVTTLLRLDSAGTLVNIGPNPHFTATAAAQNNALVQSQFASAVLQLQQRMTFCTQNPTASGCPAFNARQAEAQQLLTTSQGFATDLADLYGSASGGGMRFVPISGSTAQTAIAQRIGTLNGQFQSLLDPSINYLQASPTAAGGPVGSAEFLKEFHRSRRDSLSTLERVGLGDLEVGFKALLIDRRRTDVRRLGIQLAVASSVRLPTGSPQSPSAVVDMRFTNAGTTIDSRALLDVRAGRFGLLGSGSFAQVLEKDAPDDPNAALVVTSYPRSTRYTELAIAPRWHVSEPLAIHGAYSLRSSDKTGGDQLVGGGVSYSTLASYAGSGSLPIEMRFTHLEAIKGDDARPKFVRDHVELRIYFRLR